MKSRIDLEDIGIDPDGCCYCLSGRAIRDKYGFPWCSLHQHRGELLDWGWQHGWPELACSPYAIGPGEYCWNVAITAGNDELIWMALAAIAHMEAEKAP